MDSITAKVSKYIQGKGVPISVIAEKTGFSYGVLYPSLCQNPTRRLRGDELLAVCGFLGVDPREFEEM